MLRCSACASTQLQGIGSRFYGVEHTVEVTAGSVYEAVAAALAVFRGDGWVGQITTGLTTVSVKVQQPAIEHQVKIQDFLAWLGKKAGSPAEIALNKKMLSSNTARPKRNP
jgi:hypothetical protein